MKPQGSVNEIIFISKLAFVVKSVFIRILSSIYIFLVVVISKLAFVVKSWFIRPLSSVYIFLFVAISKLAPVFMTWFIKPVQRVAFITTEPVYPGVSRIKT